MNKLCMSTAVKLACISQTPQQTAIHTQLAATVAAYKQQSAELARMLAGQKDIHAELAKTLATLRQTMRLFAPKPAPVYQVGSSRAA